MKAWPSAFEYDGNNMHGIREKKKVANLTNIESLTAFP
jgi:hypothetical protein